MRPIIIIKRISVNKEPQAEFGKRARAGGGFRGPFPSYQETILFVLHSLAPSIPRVVGQEKKRARTSGLWCLRGSTGQERRREEKNFFPFRSLCPGGFVVDALCLRALRAIQQFRFRGHHRMALTYRANPYYYPPFSCFFSKDFTRSSSDVISITQRRGDAENPFFDSLCASASLREVLFLAGSGRIRRVEIHDVGFSG
jgi:hypothetical protein